MDIMQYSYGAVQPAHCSDEEWALRIQLAHCYRLVDYLGWTEMIFNHISVRVPGPEHHYLVNPFALNYNEVTPANLLKVGLDGHLAEPSDYKANPADAKQLVVHLQPVAVRCGQPFVRRPGLALPAHVLALVRTDCTVRGRRRCIFMLGTTGAAYQFHVELLTVASRRSAGRSVAAKYLSAKLYYLSAKILARVSVQWQTTSISYSANGGLSGPTSMFRPWESSDASRGSRG